MVASSELVIQKLQLDRLLDDAGFHYDLRQGVLYNPAKTRCCLLSTDLLSGVYKALSEEAGEAWTVILKGCGVIWGERLAKRIDRELQLLFQIQLSELPVSRFVDFIHQYFAFHGWGDLNIHLDHAPRGIVEASLRDSIFKEVITDSPEMVDWLMSGILASLFSYLSGQALDSLQTVCASQGAPRSLFLVSAEQRIENATQLLLAGSTHTQLIEKL